MKVNCGDNIKKYRIQNGWSQDELGKKLGVKQGAISSWEKNRTEPNMGQIETMCKLFDCQKTDIVKITEDIPNIPYGTAELIDLYSRATQEQRNAVLNLLRSFVNG